MFVIKGKIKEVAKNFNVGSDVPAEIDRIVEEILTKGLRRAEANGRKTLMAKDL